MPDQSRPGGNRGNWGVAPRVPPPTNASPDRRRPCARRLWSALARFHLSEAASVTTDFVVLTAAAMAIGISVANSVAGGATEQSEDVATCLQKTGKMINKNIPHQKQLKRAAKKCRKL